jgi:3'-phosphoadenosine 5'-phosphosulfate sulfotransferase
MMKNITLSAPEDVIAKARRYAKVHNKTLNQLVRDYLSQLGGERDPKQVAAEFAAEALSQSGCSEEGWRFNREEIHKRGSWS